MSCSDGDIGSIDLIIQGLAFGITFAEIESVEAGKALVEAECFATSSAIVADTR